MEKVSNEEISNYDKETVLSGVVRVCFVLVSVAAIAAAVLGILGFVALVL